MLLQWRREEADVELNGQRHGTCRTCSSSVPTPSHTPTEPPSPAKNRAEFSNLLVICETKTSKKCACVHKFTKPKLTSKTTVAQEMHFAPGTTFKGSITGPPPPPNPPPVAPEEVAGAGAVANIFLKPAAAAKGLFGLSRCCCSCCCCCCC